jgi:hypothetical protein
LRVFHQSFRLLQVAVCSSLSPPYFTCVPTGIWIAMMMVRL